MSGKHDRSPEAREDRRLDRNGWLFAFVTVAISCMVTLAVSSGTHPWH